MTRGTDRIDRTEGRIGAADRLRKLEGLRLDRPEDRGAGGAPRAWVRRAILLAGAAAGVISLWGWLRGPVASVRVAPVAEIGGSTASSSSLEGTGYVVARRRATVASETTGRVEALLVEEGMQVQAGQVLARLDDALQTRRLQLAEAELGAARSAEREAAARFEEARVELVRTRELAAAHIASMATLDRAEAQFDALRARLEGARQAIVVAGRNLDLRKQELEDTLVRAPFDGVVISRETQPGEVVSPVSLGGGSSAGICTIVDPNSLEIEVDVNEIYVSRVRAEQRARVVLDAYPDWEIPARVITTIPAADRQKATVRIRVGFGKEKTDARVLPEMGVKVFFLSDERGPEEAQVARTVLPGPALRRDENGETYVLSLIDDRVERRIVRVAEEGMRDGGWRVLEGLAPGERVVVEGPGDLADGDAVRVVSNSENETGGVK